MNWELNKLSEEKAQSYKKARFYNINNLINKIILKNIDIKIDIYIYIYISISFKQQNKIIIRAPN